MERKNNNFFKKALGNKINPSWKLVQFQQIIIETRNPFAPN